jgi:outer membrane lipoprotein SlyB
MNTVLGLFKPDQVAPAVERLTTNGFDMTDLSVVSIPGSIPEHLMGEAQEAAGEGMAVGAATGGVLGALGALVASTIPGMEFTVVSGLLGTAAGGAVGAYLGGLYTMRAETQDEFDLKDALDAGDVLVLVQATPEGSDRAEALMSEAGGYHVEVHALPDDEATAA